MLNRDAIIKYDVSKNTVIIWRQYRGERKHKLIRSDSFLPKSMHRLYRIIDLHMRKNVYYQDEEGIYWYTHKWIFSDMSAPELKKMLQTIFNLAYAQISQDERENDFDTLIEIEGLIRGTHIA